MMRPTHSHRMWILWVRLLIILILFGGYTPVAAQIGLVGYLNTYDTLFNYRQSANENRVAFFSPAYDIYERDLPDAYSFVFGVNDRLVTMMDDPTVLEEFTNRENATVYLRYHTQNITSLVVHVFNVRTRTWLKKGFTVEQDGYTLPDHFRLSDFESIEGGSTYKPGVILEVVKADQEKDATLMISDFYLGELTRNEYSIEHPFFEGIIQHTSNAAVDKPAVRLPIIESPRDFDYLNPPASLHLSSAAGEMHEGQVTYELISRALTHYPFYEERVVNEREAKSIFEEQFRVRLLESTEVGCSLFDSLSLYLKTTFNDPHFGIRNKACKPVPAKRTTRGPIRFYGINGQVQVAVTLNDKYQHIPVGAELRSIDGKDPEVILDSLHRVFPTSDRNNLIPQISTFSRDRVVSMQFSGVQETVQVYYSDRQSVPSNFRYEHGYFEVLDDDISYLIVKRWTLEVYLKLMNHWEEISNSNGLILDLRGNGGGEMLAALRVFSLFIERPTIYESKWEAGVLTPYLVAPNKLRSFSQEKQVHILVDERTACSSELFSMGMKALPNVTVLGRTRTFGTDAARYDLHFPSGQLLFINAIAPKSIYEDDIVLENQGIAPDLQIRPASMLDLRPYEDKVLQESISLVTKYNLNKQNREN